MLQAPMYAFALSISATFAYVLCITELPRALAAQELQRDSTERRSVQYQNGDATIAATLLAPARNHFTIITTGGAGHALFRDDIVALLAEWIQGRGRGR